MLSDPDSATIRRYGILDTVVEEWMGTELGDDPGLEADATQYVTVSQRSERFRGVPFPGTFVLDSQGRVTARFFEDSYRERNTASHILLRLDKTDSGFSKRRQWVFNFSRRATEFTSM